MKYHFKRVREERVLFYLYKLNLNINHVFDRTTKKKRGSRGEGVGKLVVFRTQNQD